MTTITGTLTYRFPTADDCTAAKVAIAASPDLTLVSEEQDHSLVVEVSLAL